MPSTRATNERRTESRFEASGRPIVWRPMTPERKWRMGKMCDFSRSSLSFTTDHHLALRPGELVELGSEPDAKTMCCRVTRTVANADRSNVVACRIEIVRRPMHHTDTQGPGVAA